MEEAAAMRGGGRREKKREMETGKPGERDSGTLTSCAGFNTQSLLWVRPPTRECGHRNK